MHVPADRCRAITCNPACFNRSRARRARSHSTPRPPPEFTSTPGQVGFSRDGRQLIVTTKGNGSNVDIFRVLDHGLLSDSPVVNNLPGAVPFAFDFDRAGNLVLTEAGPNAVESFTLRHDGDIAPITSVATGQAATCWVTHIGSHFSTRRTPAVPQLPRSIRRPEVRCPLSPTL
jgi:hypothetical protein